MSQDTAGKSLRTIGLRIHRIRKSQDKSLQIIAGASRNSKSTLHRIEHGQRDLTLRDRGPSQRTRN